MAPRIRRFTLPDSAPIMRRVMGFLSDQARTLIHAGVSRDRICIDPGPGFGKTANEDIVIQRETAKMASLGYPLMCAVSRKRFVGAVSGVTEAAARDVATFGVCLGAIQAGANIVRVHDVVPAARAAAADLDMAADGADAVRDAEIVFTMFPAGSHVIDAYAGGLLAAAPPGTLFIDSSTIAVDFTSVPCSSQRATSSSESSAARVRRCRSTVPRARA